jgi:hypothetical protein
MTRYQFLTLYSNPKREHNPLMVTLKDGRRLMAVKFDDGIHVELLGGGKVRISGLKYVGGVELREE